MNPKSSEALTTTPSDFLEDRDDDEADDDDDDDADDVLLEDSDFREEPESEASSLPGILHAHWVDALNPLPSGLLLAMIYFKAPPGVSGIVLVTFHDDDSAGQTEGSCDDWYPPSPEGFLVSAYSDFKLSKSGVVETDELSLETLTNP